MMQALIAGGMDAAWSEDRDRMITAVSDEHYRFNPESLLEVPLREYGELDFPLKYQGKLIKVMLWGLDGLAVNPDGYRVIIMLRDPEESRQSYEATGRRGNPNWYVQYQERIQRAVQQLKNRRDVLSVKVIDYVTLLNDTENELEFIDSTLNIGRASKVINPDLYRFRRERLTVGI